MSKISEQQLKEIIREELQEQGILSKIGKWFKKTPQPGVTQPGVFDKPTAVSKPPEATTSPVPTLDEPEKEKQSAASSVSAEPQQPAAGQPEQQPQEPRSIKPPKGARDIKGSVEYKKSMSDLSSILSKAEFIKSDIAQKIVNDIHSLMGNGKFSTLVLKEQEHILNISQILDKNGIKGTFKIKLLKLISDWAAANSKIVKNEIGKSLSQVPTVQTTQPAKPVTAPLQKGMEKAGGRLGESVENKIYDKWKRLVKG